MRPVLTENPMGRIQELASKVVLAIMRVPANGDVVNATWPDGSVSVAYRNKSKWFRWDNAAMEWNPSPAPANWRQVYPESN